MYLPPESTDIPEAGDECVSCPHPMSAHDPISARFCIATSQGGYNRGCVCTPVPTPPVSTASRR